MAESIREEQAPLASRVVQERPQRAPHARYVARIVRVAINSPLYQDTMAILARGEYLHEGCKEKACNDCRCTLGIKRKEDAQNFLALSIFLCNFGLRLAAVRKVTLGALLGAEHVPDVCPHCGSVVVYAEHKKSCRR